MPRSQFFPIRTEYKPVNNYFFPPTDKHIKGRTRSEVAQGVFYKKKIYENFWKIFGNLQKLLEIFGNSSEVFSIVFMIF